eukprot:gene797-4085_t
MGKHGRNQTASAVYSYAERMKDKKQQKYGLLSERLSADSLREVDCCFLTLQPVIDAVITPDGYLFEREAILENLLTQKQESKTTPSICEIPMSVFVSVIVHELIALFVVDWLRFKRTEAAISFQRNNPFTSDKKEKIGHATEALQAAKRFQIKTAKGEVDPQHPAFWVPAATPDAKSSTVAKPDMKTRCPVTNKPLKLKDLIPVTFTRVNPDSKVPIVAQSDRYMCPVTQTSFKGNIELAALRPSGRVVSKECIDKIVKMDMRDPISGEKLSEDDIIYLQRGASGFAGSGQQLQAAKKFATQTVT